ncbi:MAG: DUF2283 domain-containing protein [archaeon YNP-LCB-024-027]|jgi:uncharacterized protein YuzE|nr:DUF2283 domain-containing protein [Candidatus Verstraetearchaeota archaeon]MCR6624477.1 DUF2283 domain-containing protein [Candidatus Culexarchaeum yellowstonense]
MRIRYSRDEDILIIEFSDEKIDYAEEMGPIIVHFTEDGKPVMLEILDASEFIAEISKIAMRAKDEPIEV